MSCDFRLDIGKKCEVKRNKEKSKESGGSGQGKQPWRVGRYGHDQGRGVECMGVEIPFETGNLRSIPCTVYFAGGVMVECIICDRPRQNKRYVGKIDFKV